MHGSDSAAPVNEKCHRERIETTVCLSQLFVANHDRVIHPLLVQIRADRFPAILVHRDAQYSQARVAEPLLKVREPRNLNLARPAPGRPKVEYDDFPSEVGQIDLNSV